MSITKLSSLDHRVTSTITPDLTRRSFHFAQPICSVFFFSTKEPAVFLFALLLQQKHVDAGNPTPFLLLSYLRLAIGSLPRPNNSIYNPAAISLPPPPNHPSVYHPTSTVRAQDPADMEDAASILMGFPPAEPLSSDKAYNDAVNLHIKRVDHLLTQTKAVTGDNAVKLLQVRLHAISLPLHSEY